MNEWIKTHSYPVFIILSGLTLLAGQYFPDVPSQEIIASLATLLGVREIATKTQEAKEAKDKFPASPVEYADESGREAV